MEQSVGSQLADRVGEGKAAMQAEPFSSVSVPLQVKAIMTDPVEPGEGRVEFVAAILREAGAVTLNETILGTVPLAEDVDRIVELRRPDRGQETRLQEVVDQVLAGGSHLRFFCCGPRHCASRATAPTYRRTDDIC